MSKVKVAIIGASGYSGEELVRLLLRHPNAELTCVTSRQYDGEPIGTVFPRYAEAPLCFSAPDVDDIAAKAEVVFLALPHGLASEYALPLLEKGLRVIDISADFRLRDLDKYKTYYQVDHPAPEVMKDTVYGLPERYRSQIVGARLVACPGCYPTSIILPTAPLLAAGLVDTEKIAVTSMSGVSGAGRKVDLPYIFPECNESVRPYAVTGHRHLPEIEQELAAAAGCEQLAISFIPHLMPVSRGIHSTILLNAKEQVTVDKLSDVLHQAYDNEPFVRVLPHGKLADTKHVTMTNMCEIGFALDERTQRVIISSAIDNLTKGASGQAVQCMNIVCGFSESAGL